ncbi:MAG TPA: VOC family protein, partial [Gemmatimonadaceae bacterium]|nr:VOC family protein [Gemmatimonadaceae bacterium]
MPTPNTAPTASAQPILNRLTPVLVVDSVELSTSFWVSRFGFELTNQVPGPEGKLVFASVSRGAVEIMYQTRASVIADGATTAQELAGHSVTLFIEVASIDAVEKALSGA